MLSLAVIRFDGSSRRIQVQLARTLADVQIKEHRSVQVAVARYCEKLGNREVVIVHNSGQEVTHGHREECLEWLNVRPKATDKGMPLAGVECVINPRGRSTC